MNIVLLKNYYLTQGSLGTLGYGVCPEMAHLRPLHDLYSTKPSSLDLSELGVTRLLTLPAKRDMLSSYNGNLKKSNLTFTQHGKVRNAMLVIAGKTGAVKLNTSI